MGVFGGGGGVIFVFFVSQKGAILAKNAVFGHFWALFENLDGVSGRSYFLRQCLMILLKIDKMGPPPPKTPQNGPLFLKRMMKNHIFFLKVEKMGLTLVLSFF